MGRYFVKLGPLGFTSAVGSNRQRSLKAVAQRDISPVSRSAADELSLDPTVGRDNL